MATPVIVVGSNSFADATQAWAIHKFDAAANVYPHGHRSPNHGAFLAAITGIAIDGSGNVYCCSWNNAWTGSTGYDDQPATIPGAYGSNAEYPQWTVRKYNPDGFKVWEANHGAECHDLVLDGSGNVYICGAAVNSSGVVINSVSADRTGYYTTRKYSNDGTLLWSADHGISVAWLNDGYRMRIAVDASGNVYTLAHGGPAGDLVAKNVTKYNSSGVVQWSIKIDYLLGYTNPYGLAVDSSGNVYVAGRIGTDYSLIKYDSSGNQLALAVNVDSAKYGRAVAIDGAGDVILATSATLNRHLHKYDSDLALIDSAAMDAGHEGSVTSMALDADDVAYCAIGTGYLEAYSTSSGTFGDKLWGTRPTLADDDGSALAGWCVALSEVETPPLKMPMNFGIPSWIGDYYASVPGLPFVFALGLPAWLRDYIGPPRTEICRLFLTGTPDLELPLSSLSLRANAGGVYVSVVSPGATLDTVAAIEARDGGNVQVYRGVRFPDGTEQLELLVDAPLTHVSYDLGARSGSLSLMGRVASAVDYAKTRQVRHLSYRNESAGIRRIRAAIDTQLRVGDTVQLAGGELLIISNITITVSATQAVMEISE